MSSCVCRIPAIRIRCGDIDRFSPKFTPKRGSQIRILDPTWTILEAVAIAAAGFGAGVINTVVGSGTLLTFPVLLGFGYAPVTANVSNTIGLVPGGVSGTYGYRAELAGRGRRAVSMAIASIAGALARRDAPAHAPRVGVREGRPVPDRRRPRADPRAALAVGTARGAAPGDRLPRRRLDSRRAVRDRRLRRLLRGGAGDPAARRPQPRAHRHACSGSTR